MDRFARENGWKGESAFVAKGPTAEFMIKDMRKLGHITTVCHIATTVSLCFKYLLRKESSGVLFIGIPGDLFWML